MAWDNGAATIFLLAAVACGPKQVDMKPASTVPAAAGHVEIDTDRNGNSTVDLNVKHLAKPENLTPPGTAYVIWIQAPGQPPQSAGQLQVNSNLDGEFKGTTPFKTFDIFVTSENNPQMTKPSGQEVMRQHVSR